MLDDIYAISFDGNRIDLVPGVNVYNHDSTRFPNRDIKMYKLARRSKSIITSSEFTDKEIPVYAEICSGGVEATKATIRQVKALLIAQNAQFKILDGGLEIEYTATLNEFNIDWDAGIAMCQLVFLASDPIGSSTSETNLAVMTGVTTQAAAQTVSVLGSFNAEPKITVTIRAITGGTAGTINLYNARTNQGITVTSNFAVNDILVVDCELYTVQKNGANLDYQGIFPVFPPGSQQIGYSDTFTTRTVDLTATYKQQTV